jgi:hypothetical protein
MCRRKSKVVKNPIGCYTFIKLEDWGSATTYSDPLRDGNLYAYVVEVQVLPDGLAMDLMCYSLGGIFYQEAVQIVALLIRADPFHSLTTGQQLISEGTDVEIFPRNMRERRMALNSEQTVQRLARPPKLSGSGPGGGRNAHKWAKDMFDELGSRMVSLDVVRVTTNLLTEEKPHFKIGQPASGVVVPPADVEMGQGGVALSVMLQASPVDAGTASIGSTATSVIPLAPPMDAGTASIDPAAAAIHIQVPHSDDVVDDQPLVTRRANAADGDGQHGTNANVGEAHVRSSLISMMRLLWSHVQLPTNYRFPRDGGMPHVSHQPRAGGQQDVSSPNSTQRQPGWLRELRGRIPNRTL